MEEKERLTEKDEKGEYFFTVVEEPNYSNGYEGEEYSLIGKHIDKLASYENTGLSPEEVEALKKENEELKLQLSTKNNIISFAQSSYDLLKEENKKLHSGQTKLVVEKLEELKQHIENNGLVVWETNKQTYSITDKINSLLAELKGGGK